MINIRRRNLSLKLKETFFLYKKKPIYIFVLCPPFQGSTIITKLLDSSEFTSSFIDTSDWAGEGQKFINDPLYEENKWNPNYKLDMDMVKKCYDENWNLKKNIFVEKSPPMICRAKMFEDYFSKFGDVYFIISIRSPYSSRNSIKEWLKFATYQKNNINILNKTLVTSYEEICNNKSYFIEKLINFIPELSTLKDKKYYGKKRLGNRFDKINNNEVDRVIDLDKKKNLLSNEEDLIKFFGYEVK